MHINLVFSYDKDVPSDLLAKTIRQPNETHSVFRTLIGLTNYKISTQSVNIRGFSSF